MSYADASEANERTRLARRRVTPPAALLPEPIGIAPAAYANYEDSNQQQDCVGMFVAAARKSDNRRQSTRQQDQQGAQYHQVSSAECVRVIPHLLVGKRRRGPKAVQAVRPNSATRQGQ